MKPDHRLDVTAEIANAETSRRAPRLLGVKRWPAPRTTLVRLPTASRPEWEHRQMPERPGTTDFHHLMALRAMLDDASRYASNATPLQRPTAVVLLDGVVERALHLVAVSVGQSVPTRADFNDLVSRVKGALGDAWSPRALPDVRQLHRARNVAQHEGLAPAAESIPTWSTATAAFIKGLVDAHYGVDLDRVALTDAVENAELRQILEMADAAKTDAPEQSVRASLHAVSEADKVWARMHKGSAAFTLLSAVKSYVRGATWASNEAIEELERRTRLDAFAPDPAEAVWFLRLRSEHSGTFDTDDAERALAFATNWVLRFEAAKSTWVPDRRERANQRARLERSNPGDPAFIHSVDSVNPSGRGVSITVRLGGVPRPADYYEWVDRVETRAKQLDEGFRWKISGDGSAHVALSDIEPVEQLIAELTEALTLSDVPEPPSTSAEPPVDIEALDRDFQAGVAGRSLPPWVDHLAVTLSGEEPVIAISVSEEYMQSMLPAAGGWNGDIAGLLRSRHAGTVRWEDERTIAIQPALPATDLVQILEDVGREVEEREAREREVRETWSIQESALRQRLEAAIQGSRPRAC